MIHYKVSILIVLISEVCFLAAVKPEKQERTDDSQDRSKEKKKLKYMESQELDAKTIDDIDNCLDAMRKAFGTSKSKGCVHAAIPFMKLYGDHAITYHVGVAKYYETLYDYVQLDSVLLPEHFCNERNKDPDCYNHLKIFEEMNPGPPGASSSENSLEMTVLINALYYHVIFYRTKRQPPEDDARKYFHEYESRGYTYLTELSRNIKFKKDVDRTDHPAAFCRDLYISTQPDSKAKKGEDTNEELSKPTLI